MYAEIKSIVNGTLEHFPEVPEAPWASAWFFPWSQPWSLTIPLHLDTNDVGDRSSLRIKRSEIGILGRWNVTLHFQHLNFETRTTTLFFFRTVCTGLNSYDHKLRWTYDCPMNVQSELGIRMRHNANYTRSLNLSASEKQKLCSTQKEYLFSNYL